VWITRRPKRRGGVEHGAARRDGRGQPRDVVAERLSEAARLQEVPLHVEDDGRGPIERTSIGPGSAWTRILTARPA